MKRLLVTAALILCTLPCAAQQVDTLYADSGEGTFWTPTFTAPSPFTIHWQVSNESSFLNLFKDGTMQMMIQTTPAEKYYPYPGTYRLHGVTAGRWSVVITTAE